MLTLRGESYGRKKSPEKGLEVEATTAPVVVVDVPAVEPGPSVYLADPATASSLEPDALPCAPSELS